MNRRISHLIQNMKQLIHHGLIKIGSLRIYYKKIVSNPTVIFKYLAPVGCFHQQEIFSIIAGDNTQQWRRHEVDKGLIKIMECNEY